MIDRPLLFGALAALLLGSSASLPAAAPPGATPPEASSWYGDPKAPDISGVWVRTDNPAGASSKEGWGPWPPPLKPAFAAIWKQRVADDAAGTRKDDPIRGCLPPGMPRFMTGATGPLLITQTPGRVMLVRDGLPVRRVWVNGRKLPDAKDIESFFGGNSIGHYEGTDLVTEVAGIRQQPIDATGIPHSDDLKIVERFHRIDAKTLRVELTLTDRTAFTKPMKSVVIYKAVDDPAWEPKEVLCTPETNYHPEAYVR